MTSRNKQWPSKRNLVGSATWGWGFWGARIWGGDGPVKKPTEFDEPEKIEVFTTKKAP